MYIMYNYAFYKFTFYLFPYLPCQMFFLHFSQSIQNYVFLPISIKSKHRSYLGPSNIPASRLSILPQLAHDVLIRDFDFQIFPFLGRTWDVFSTLLAF